MRLKDMRGYVYFYVIRMLRLFVSLEDICLQVIYKQWDNFYTLKKFEEISFAPNVIPSDFMREVLLVTGSLHFQPRNANDLLSQRHRGDLFIYSLVTNHCAENLPSYKFSFHLYINTPSVGERKNY